MGALDWGIVGAYFAALIWFGWRERGGLSGGAVKVILGGRALTLPAFVATLVTTWYGGILGVGEYSYNFGISNWVVFGVPYYLGALVFALFLARRARTSQALTVPARIHARIGRRSALAAAVLVFATTAPTAYVLMLGALAHFFFGVSVTVGAVIAGAFSLIYVFLGGFQAVVRTDKLQFALMFGGFALLFILLVSDYGFVEFLRQNTPDGHFSWSGGASGWYIASWYVIAQGALVEPTFHQRCFAARDAGVARNGILLSIAFWLLFDFMTTACGLYARALLPELANPALAFPRLAELILPGGTLGLFVVGLLAVVMSTIDSYSFVAATTFSHDIVKHIRRWSHLSLRTLTLIGLALSTAVAFSFSLAFESIVTVWREFGSVLMPALLAPLLIAYTNHRRLKISDRQGLALTVIPGAVSLTWILYKYLGATGDYPFAAYPFLGEPIFPGLYVSALMALWYWSRGARA